MDKAIFKVLPYKSDSNGFYDNAIRFFAVGESIILTRDRDFYSALGLFLR